MFKKKNKEIKDPSESRFEAMMDLVKDLTPKDYKRLKKAMDSGYEAYNIVRNIETDDDSIDLAENQLSTYNQIPIKKEDKKNDNNKKS